MSGYHCVGIVSYYDPVLQRNIYKTVQSYVSASSEDLARRQFQIMYSTVMDVTVRYLGECQ